MGRKAARNMYSRNTNKIGIQCICWFYSQGSGKCNYQMSYYQLFKKDCVTFITSVSGWLQIPRAIVAGL